MDRYIAEPYLYEISEASPSPMKSPVALPVVQTAQAIRFRSGLRIMLDKILGYYPISPNEIRFYLTSSQEHYHFNSQEERDKALAALDEMFGAKAL